MRGWKRVTPLSEVLRSTTTNFDGLNRTEPALDRGSQNGMLFGSSRPPPQNLSNNEKQDMPPKDFNFPEQDTTSQQEDFSWWRNNLVDPRTGKTSDSRLLYDISAEDRGICKSALVGRPCPLGSDCPFTHPVRQFSAAGKEICVGFAELSRRSSLDINDTALIRILDVTSPLCFSVWILKEGPVTMEEAGCCLNGEMLMDSKPPGLQPLLEKMAAFYKKNDRSYLAYRSLTDVTDVFVAVYQLFNGQMEWLRGTVMDEKRESVECGQGYLKVHLMDIGKVVKITQTPLLRRLHQGFLKEPWFAIKVGLGKICLPAGGLCSSTLSWFANLVKDKMAFARVVGEMDKPLLDLFMPMDTDILENLNCFLVKEGVALADEASQSDSEDDDETVCIVPG